MAKLRSTFIRRILGRKSQRLVDGQVVDITDRDGNVKVFWTLVWEYVRDSDVVERKTNIFPNQLSGGRDGESMFWARQDLRGLVDQIRSIEPGQEVELEEKIPATVQYDGKWWNLVDIGRSGTPGATEESNTTPQPNPEMEARMSKVEGDLDTIKELLQQLVKQQ